MKSLLLVLVACGGDLPAPQHAHAQPRPLAPATAATPGEAECDQLFAHVAALVSAERTAPDGDRDIEKGIEHAQYMAECRVMPRADYQCAMVARTSDEVAACDRDHATPSSSTSNNSVAPGGMTPAAPRSP